MATKVLIPRIQKNSLSSSASTSSGSESDGTFIRPTSTPGRKRKLDHLTYEEKVQRKKMKNRVAAQTSRDRKKKQMEEMVDTIEKQSKEITQWKNQCNQLKLKCEKLEKELAKLKISKKSAIKQEEEKVSHSIPEEHKYTRLAPRDEKKSTDDNFVGSIFIKPEPAAFNDIPLQKVNMMKTETTERSSEKYSQKRKSDVMALLRVIILCLLYKNSSMESTSMMKNFKILKTLQKSSSQISRQELKQILQQAISEMPKKKAMNSNCLDQWWGRQQCLGRENQQWTPPKIPVEAQ